MSLVLVVEDEPDAAAGISMLLDRRGYTVVVAGDGPSALRSFHESRPDLVLLDIALPGMDGWHVLTRIRELSDVPVMMLTARGDETDKVRGLRGGADDYLVKPFGREELVARVEVLLRHRPTKTTPVDEVYEDQVVRVDPGSWTIWVDGEPCEVSPTGFRVMLALVRNAGHVLTPTQLLTLAWPDGFAVGEERVKYAVLRLRRDLGLTGAGSPIESVRGVGYRYRARP